MLVHTDHKESMGKLFNCLSLKNKNKTLKELLKKMHDLSFQLCLL